MNLNEKLKYLKKPNNTHCLARFAGYSSGNSLLSNVKQIDGDAKFLLMKLGFKAFAEMSLDELKKFISKHQGYIKQIKDDKIINTYNSLEEASLKSGVSRQMIQNCLIETKKHYKTAGGYEWKYLWRYIINS